MTMFPAPGGWTNGDLDSMPEDNRRRELLDGVLLMPPVPPSTHQIVTARLMVALEESCPQDLQPVQAVEVRFGPRLSFTPDGVVAADQAAVRRFYTPDEVVLAVEVEAPESYSMDRILKPVLYARAGIPFFWLIETHDHELTVRTHRLEGEVYRPTGTFTETITIDQPWQIDIPIARLRARHL